MNFKKHLIGVCFLMIFYFGFPTFLFAATSSFQTSRIFGQDRIDTAIAASQAGWQTSDTVFLDEQNDYPDAIAATPLATQLNAPILLSSGKTLDSRVVAEIKRLKAKKVILLGGRGCLTSSIEQTLDEMNLIWERIGGYDRYETSVLIANRIQSDSVIVVNGDDFPDALTSSSYAGIRQIPIVLVSKEYLPDSVKQYLNQKNPAHLIVVGGEAVVPTSLLKGHPIESRLGGHDRYDTSKLLYEYSKPYYASSSFYLASGENFPDAMVGTVLAAKNKAPLLMTTKNNLAPQTDSIFGSATKPSSSTVITGTTIASRLNFRQSPDINAPILTTIPQNTQVIVHDDTASKWAQISYQDKTGWVSKDYLQINTNVSRGDSLPSPVYILGGTAVVSDAVAQTLQSKTRSISPPLVTPQSDPVTTPTQPSASPLVPITVNPLIQEKTIVIDAGHGSPDAGAIGYSGTYEKDNNLALALNLAEKLKAGGANVLLTRSKDTSPAAGDFSELADLESRVQLANAEKADLFISLHNDAFTASTVSGVGTFYSSDNLEASKSQLLARCIQEHLQSASGFIDRGVKDAGFYVVRRTNMPAVLIETGFITNPDEEAQLKDAAFQDLAAYAIYQGVLSYYQSLVP